MGQARFALPDDGPAIAAIQNYDDAEVGALDWSDVTGWLVYELDGEVQACVQVLPGRPIGMLEHMAFAEGLDRRELVLAIRDLNALGVAMLTGSGSQLARATIGLDDPMFQRMSEKKGWRALEDVRVIAKRLT